MNFELLKTVARNWYEVFGKSIKDCPGEARLITGDFRTDARYHYFEKESGITIQFADDCRTVTGYEVVDSEKFVWFVLRWS